MDVVLGGGPVATALARATGACLASSEPVSGPFLWRRASLDTGQGVLAATRDAARIWLFLPDDRPAHGALAVLQQLPPTPGVLAIPPGVAVPSLSAFRPGWTVVRTPGTLGPDEPLVARWTEIIRRGGHLWDADPGPLHAADEGEVVAALRSAMDAGDAETVPTRRFTLPSLAARVAREVGRPLRVTRAPFALAMWKIGLSAAEVRGRFSAEVSR